MEKTIGQEFMLRTQCVNCVATARDKKLPPPLSQLPYDKSVQIIQLPEPDMLEDREVNFLELVELRTTVRKYRDIPVSLKELSYLLWCTQGVKMAIPGEKSMRTVPSAGARHAFETYIYVNRVEGLLPGLYRFLAMEHALIPVDLTGTFDKALPNAFMKQPSVINSAVNFIWAAVPERMVYAYGQRAYRYLHLDAGHVCQNLYLAAQTIGCGVCAIAHFDDEKLNDALGLDGEAQFAIYAAAIGK